MFCKVCGRENDPASRYCSNDGVSLHSETKGFTIKNGNFSFCRECGRKAGKSDLYCGNCGSSLFSIEKTKKTLPTNVIKETSISSEFNIMELLKYSLIGSGIIFVIALISSGMINDKFVNILSAEIGQDLDIKLLNLFDAMAMLNASSLKLNIMAFGQNALELSLDGMFFIIIMIAIIIFSILGAFISKKKNKRELLKDYIVIGLFYGFIISIMTIFASRKLDFNVPFAAGFSDFEMMNMTKKYSFFSAFRNSFMISFFSMSLGNGIYNFFKDLKSRNFTYLSVASMVLGISLIFSFIATMIMTSGEGMLSTGMGGIEEIGAGLIKGQIFIYSLILMNMGIFNIRLDGEVNRLSAFQNTEILSDGILSNGYLYTGLLISIFSFFFHGRSIKKRNEEIKKLFYAPAIFALGITILSYVASIRLTTNLMPMISFESSYILSFISSFLIAMLGSLAGYFLTASEGERVDSDE